MKTVIILLGAPGSGKGTQSLLLKDYYHIAHVSTGDMLRAEIEKKTELGLTVEGILSAGKLVDDATMTNMLRIRLQQSDCANGFVLDGYPRQLEQAKLLDDLFEELGINKKYILEIFVKEDILIKRISGRYSCSNCGAIYNKFFSPTQIPNICDKCGGNNFITRSDDNENIVSKRIKLYNQQINAIVSYYEKEDKIYKLNGGKSSQELLEDIKEVII